MHAVPSISIAGVVLCLSTFGKTSNSSTQSSIRHLGEYIAYQAVGSHSFSTHYTTDPHYITFITAKDISIAVEDGIQPKHIRIAVGLPADNRHCFLDAVWIGVKKSSLLVSYVFSYFLVRQCTHKTATSGGLAEKINKVTSENQRWGSEVASPVQQTNIIIMNNHLRLTGSRELLN